jgi:hypothetical protein
MLNTLLMKIRLIPKILAFLLLPAFLVIHASDAIGYAWCFGDDGHVDIKAVSCEDSCGKTAFRQDATEPLQPAALEAGDENCGPCLDLYIEQVAATLKKRHKKTALPTLKIAPANSLPSSSQQAVMMEKFLPQPPRQTSQTLLVHRTVVLLH